jgi:hypothetical protein
MTMHLERGLTTTSTRKRKIKITKAQQEEFERGWRDRNIRLKQMGLPKETFEQYMDFVHGKSKKASGQKAYEPKSSKAVTTTYTSRKQSIQSEGVVDNNAPSNEVSKSSRIWVTGACTSKPSPVYTGTKVVGIATMHKSNAVPIFSDTEAKEVSSMRR